MREVPLSRGKVALIDDEDYELVSQHPYSWRLTSTGYAAAGDETVYMHRLVAGLNKGDKRKIDHIDGNRLNNQKHNLRVASRSGNHCNKSKHKNNTSGFKGVIWHKQAQKWYARVTFNYRAYSAGLHDTPEEAADARDALAKELHGAFFRASLSND